jgi:hypothetical protein
MNPKASTANFQNQELTLKERFVLDVKSHNIIKIHHLAK